LSLQLRGRVQQQQRHIKAEEWEDQKREYIYWREYSDYVAGECTVCKLQIVSKNDIFTAGDRGYILYIVQGFFL
jgi:hypothetical protein